MYNNVADDIQADFTRELLLENNNYNEDELFEEGKDAARPDVAIISGRAAVSEAVTLDVPDQEQTAKKKDENVKGTFEFQGGNLADDDDDSDDFL